MYIITFVIYILLYLFSGYS